MFARSCCNANISNQCIYITVYRLHCLKTSYYHNAQSYFALLIRKKADSSPQLVKIAQIFDLHTDFTRKTQWTISSQINYGTSHDFLRTGKFASSQVETSQNNKAILNWKSTRKKSNKFTSSYLQSNQHPTRITIYYGNLNCLIYVFNFIFHLKPSQSGRDTKITR